MEQAASSEPITASYGGTWVIDSRHSSACFAVRHHAVATFHGSFTGVSGSFDGDVGRLRGSVRVEDIQVAGLARLAEHVLTPDFFDAGRHPTLSFTSDAIAFEHDRLSIRGEITMRGVTRPLTATGTIRGPVAVAASEGRTEDHLGMDLAATVDRHDFGIAFNHPLPDGQENPGAEVRIDVSLELIRRADA